MPSMWYISTMRDVEWPLYSHNSVRCHTDRYLPCPASSNDGDSNTVVHCDVVVLYFFFNTACGNGSMKSGVMLIKLLSIILVIVPQNCPIRTVSFKTVFWLVVLFSRLQVQTHAQKFYDHKARINPKKFVLYEIGPLTSMIEM